MVRTKVRPNLGVQRTRCDLAPFSRPVYEGGFPRCSATPMPVPPSSGSRMRSGSFLSSPCPSQAHTFGRPSFSSAAASSCSAPSGLTRASLSGITALREAHHRRMVQALPSLTSRRRLAILPLLIAGACAMPGPGPAPYRAKIVFRQNSPIRFRHFALTFIGERHESFPQYPRGFHYYDFRVVSGSESLTVSWSSGTGEIAPTSFAVSGRRFLLELVHSDRLGSLKADELVVTRD